MGSHFAEWSQEPRSADPLVVELRSATRADQTRLDEIQLASSRSPVDLGRMLDDVDRSVLVAEHRGRAVGWAGTHRLRAADGLAGAGYYLAGVVVTPAARGRSVGFALTRARLEWIWGRADEAWYFANAQNTVSIALHTRFGFEQVAEATSVHGVEFEDGRGLIFRAARSRGTALAAS